MSYIKKLEKQIYWYNIHEQCTPEIIVKPAQEMGPVYWPLAIEMYDEGFEDCWRAVAEAHAGRELTDGEFLATYGKWQDRHTEPGVALLRIIYKDRRPQSSGE